MVKRQTWILLAACAVLIGLAIFWTSYQNNYRQSHPTPSPTPQQYLFTLTESAIAGIKIVSNADGKTVTVGRDANGQWSLTEPPAAYTDISSVEAAATQLSSLQVLLTLETTDNLADYGLDNPKYTLTINENGGLQYTAQIGNVTPTSNGYYVLTPGGLPQIVSKTSIDAVLKLWQNPPIATPTVTPTLNVTVTATVEMTVTSPTEATETAVPTAAATATPVPATSTPLTIITPVAVTPTDTTEP